uniref:NADH-ubiquinone oxidoreductase chain 6 n=1 Tax=Ostreobium quekettii TaxID=121088 RepID=A0A650BXF5_9CHLO|nr:NADH dehydrogenase subunit 6 [Ostreobium quekettii]QGQ62017.1 NADH dehydrogenase subunit 6 [Ostreobium quekettii]
MIFLVVYIGAIAVLFLFVVMMLNIKLAEINEKKYRYLPIGGLLGILFLFEIFCIIDNDLIALIDSGVSIANSTQLVEANSSQLNSDLLTLDGGIAPIFYKNLLFTEWSELAENLTNIQSIGQCIYTYYSYFFICASFILLVAMIGAIVLTHHQSVYVQTQKELFQNTREFSKTIQKHKGRPVFT